MKRLHNSLFLILFIITASCFGYSFKPPTKTGAAGAPDNGETCISCHGSSGNGSLVVSNLPNQYKSGEKYTLSIKLSQSGRQRWGFILTALDENGNQAGTFESNDANTQVFSASGRQYIGHTSSGTAAGQSNSNTWLMDWIAPAVDKGKFHSMLRAMQPTIMGEIQVIMDIRQRFLSRSKQTLGGHQHQ